MSKQTKFIEKNLPDIFKVQVRHLHPGNSGKHIRKGHMYMTTCTITDKNTHKVLARSEAWCSKRESPNRKIGRQVAIGRAFKQAVIHEVSDFKRLFKNYGC